MLAWLFMRQPPRPQGPVEVHLHLFHHGDPPDPAVMTRLSAIDAKLATLVTQGVQQMKANEQVLAFLADLKKYTDEIAADIDKLLAENTLSPEVVAALTAHSETLKNIAAKNYEPLPAPVEPVPPTDG